MTVDMVTDSCKMGCRICPRKGAVLARNGDIVIGEAVAKGKSRRGNCWCRAMTSS